MTSETLAMIHELAALIDRAGSEAAMPAKPVPDAGGVLPLRIHPTTP
ncbi:MAG: hypothetical protein AB7S86_02795 [Hydrogenophaga sp.]